MEADVIIDRVEAELRAARVVEQRLHMAACYFLAAQAEAKDAGLSGLASSVCLYHRMAEQAVTELRDCLASDDPRSIKYALLSPENATIRSLLQQRLDASDLLEECQQAADALMNMTLHQIDYDSSRKASMDGALWVLNKMQDMLQSLDHTLAAV
jgi:hypothetical protein